MIDRCDTIALCADKNANLETGRPIKDLSQTVINTMIIFVVAALSMRAVWQLLCHLLLSLKKKRKPIF